MAHTGTDLLSRPVSRSQPAPRRSPGLGLDDGLLVLLGSTAVVWLGLLVYVFVTMGTALP